MHYYSYYIKSHLSLTLTEESSQHVRSDLAFASEKFKFAGQISDNRR